MSPKGHKKVPLQHMQTKMGRTCENALILDHDILRRCVISPCFFLLCGACTLGSPRFTYSQRYGGEKKILSQLGLILPDSPRVINTFKRINKYWHSPRLVDKTDLLSRIHMVLAQPTLISLQESCNNIILFIIGYNILCSNFG